MIGVETQAIVGFRVQKFKILKKVVKKIDKDEIKGALARNEIKPVVEAVTMLKILSS